MWDQSRYNKSRSQLKTPADLRRERSGKMRLKRTQALIQVSSALGIVDYEVPARIVLNDLRTRDITLFSTEALYVGMEVQLVIMAPRQFIVRGVVSYCRIFDLTPKIRTAKPYPYRVKIDFSFLNDGEMDAVREYCEELNKTILSGAA